MKVERNAPLRSTRSVAQAAYARRVEGTASTSLEGVAPAASVLGIPESEFTPKVRDAIMGLMSEVDSLRRELNQTRARLELAREKDGTVEKRYLAASRDTPAVFLPAWRLPALLVAVSLVAVALLPGTSPMVLFTGVLVLWLIAAGVFVVLRRREQVERSRMITTR